MPVHDWTRVRAGTFHDFHGRWITHLTEGLNAGLLPREYYAQSEQRVGEVIADVLTLRDAEPVPTFSDAGVAVAEAPPKVSRSMVADEIQAAAQRQRRVVIRHASGHQVIAFIEIASPANKDRMATVDAFVRKAVEAINAGVHLLLIDLFPPGPHDAGGLHRAIWDHYGEEYVPPADKPLIAVAYQAGLCPTAYLEPLAVGDHLPTMPLFLTPERYINVSLAPSYEAAWRGVPQVWKEIVEG